GRACARSTRASCRARARRTTRTPQVRSRGTRGRTSHMSRDWVTFDCYGTLADWLGGMRNALAPHVGAEDAERLLHAYHDLEAHVEAQEPAPSHKNGAHNT